MNDLYQKTCEPCRTGAAPMTKEEMEKQKALLQGWDLIESQGMKKLQKTFKFKNFRQALAFTNKAGELAEKEDHHPAILTEWGKVTITFHTHKVKGLHMNDFIMAAKTDQLI